MGEHDQNGDTRPAPLRSPSGLAEAYRQASMAELAERFGCSISTVRRALIAHKISRRRPWQRVSR